MPSHILLFLSEALRDFNEKIIAIIDPGHLQKKVCCCA